MAERAACFWFCAIVYWPCWPVLCCAALACAVCCAWPAPLWFPQMPHEPRALGVMFPPKRLLVRSALQGAGGRLGTGGVTAATCMQLMRSVDRSFTARAVAAVTGIDPEEFYDLKRGLKMAAYGRGVRGMLDQGWTPETGDLTAEAADAAASKVPTDLWVGACFCRLVLQRASSSMHSSHACVDARRGRLWRSRDTMFKLFAVTPPTNLAIWDLST